MIQMPELNYIGEEVKKSGNKLKEINGKGIELNILVESKDNKKYNINFKDIQLNKNKTPFSICNYKFTTLEEELNKINYKRELTENRVFESINKELLERNTQEFKESTIFKGYENVKDISTWRVKTVGSLNLKNGLNETYSRMTECGKELNTLIKTDSGNFYLIKGNMKERTKIGTKKEIVEGRSLKSLGNATVIGLYENNIIGLGEIMFKIKRTSIPLLCWY